MISSNFKIIVSVELDQKEAVEIAGAKFYMGKEFSQNRRESMPVLCKVESGNEHVQKGTMLLVHHNRFADNSPHHLGDNLYSLPYNQSIFASVDEKGKAHQLCGNIIVERVYDNNSELLPDHLRKPNPNKYKVVSSEDGFIEGQFVFAYPFADYEIIYNFGGEEKRVVKIIKDDIVGVFEN